MFWGKTLSELFEQGGFVMYPLLLCSIVAVGVAAERIFVLFANRSAYQSFSRALEEKLLSGGVSATPKWLTMIIHPLSIIANCSLKHAELTQEAREEIVNREASEQIAMLEKRINWLSIIGTLAPMIGLLGTVIGLVEAFYQIEQQGGQVQPGDLASGIWTALLTTVFGLIVALPTLAIYHFLDNQIAATTLRMTWISSRINEWLAKESLAKSEGSS